MNTTIQPLDIHSSAWTAAGICGSVGALRRDPGSCHQPPVISEPVSVGAAAQQLQDWPTLLLTRWKHGFELQTFLRAGLGLLWREGAQSHKLWSSKVIMQMHYGNNYSFLSPGNKALVYCVTFLLANPMVFTFCYTVYTLSARIISAKQRYKTRKQMIVLFNSIKL